MSQATVSLITVDLYVNGYKSLESTIRLGPFTPNTIIYSVSQTSLFMEEATSLTLTITTTNTIPPFGYLPTAGYLTITLPAEYNYASVVCNSVTGIASFTCSNSSGVIKIIGSSYQTSMTIVLSGLINPTAATSSMFSMNSYDSNNNAIDSSTTNTKYTVPCTLPCRSCSATLIQCLSCYTLDNLQTIVANQKYLSLGNCNIACNSSAYADVNYICYACDSSCKTCSQSATNCTSCFATSPYILNNTCYSTCPSGYYADATNSQCVACINNCKTCLSASICVTCNTNYNLNGTSCISTCPPLYYSQNQVCVPCSSNCASCDTTGCLVCNSGYYLYMGLCYLQCPMGMYI
jgi:hypothetical protein